MARGGLCISCSVFRRFSKARVKGHERSGASQCPLDTVTSKHLFYAQRTSFFGLAQRRVKRDSFFGVPFFLKKGTLVLGTRSVFNYV